MIWMFAVGAAWGQAPAEVTVPAVDTRLYRPNFDSRSALWAESAGEIGIDGAVVRSVLGYLREPVVFVADDGSRIGVIEDALLAEVLAAYRYDRLRLGVDVPVWLFASSDVAGNSTALGNVGLDGRVTLVDHTRAPIGVAISGRVTLPSASTGAPLGSSRPGGQLLALATTTLDRAQVHANVGHRFLADTPLAGTTFGDELVWTLGGGYAITDRVGVSTDLAGQANYVALRTGASTIPMELLLGGWSRVSSEFVARAGLGRGLTPGIGSPTAHGLLMLSYEPDLARDVDVDGIVDLDDGCPEVPEDRDEYEDLDGCPELDNDADGIADVDDGCVLEPEDPDDFDDHDGCPDPTRAVRVRVVDGTGGDLVDAAVTIDGRSTRIEGTGGLVADLHDGEYTIEAVAPHYFATAKQVRIPVERDEIVLVLDPEELLGMLELVVVDSAGAPLPDATWTIDGEAGPAIDQGAVALPLSEGGHALVVRAPGHVPARLDVEIAGGETTRTQVTLSAARVTIVREQIEIDEAIYFETGSATIKPASYALLDEIAGLLIDRSDIARVRIEGHTDSRGSESYNLRLSDERAASVRRYLVERGVAEARLYSVGHGESKPLDPRPVAEAWEKNRRVDFFIERAETAAESP